MATNEATAQQNATLAAQYQALAAQVIADNEKLQAANVQLVAQTKQQQEIDRSLTPPVQATRWAKLVQDATVAPVPPDIQVTPTGGFSTDANGGLATLQSLELIPSLQTQLQNAATEKTNDEKQIASQTDVVAGLNKQIGGLQTQNAEEVTTCNAAIGKVKSDDAAVLHKAKGHWFVAGYIAGLATRGAIKLFTGI